jgi:SAM-dependent methyltransferase
VQRTSPSESVDRYVGLELDVFALAIRWKAYVADMLAQYISGSVLEVGAGKGSFTVALQGSSFRKWLCLEPDATLAQEIEMRRKKDLIRSEISIVVGDMRTMPDTQMFDTILYLDVLEHIANDRAEIERANSHLLPQGRIVVLAPAFNWLFSKFDAAIGHHRRYTKTSLEKIRPSDLEIEDAFYMDAPAMILSLANRVLLMQATPDPKQILFWDRILVPVARMLDPLVGWRFGRSVVCVFRKSASADGIGLVAVTSSSPG